MEIGKFPPALGSASNFDFELAYASQPTIYDLLHDGDLISPRWVKDRDVVIEDWDDQSVTENKNYHISDACYGVHCAKCGIATVQFLALPRLPLY